MEKRFNVYGKWVFNDYIPLSCGLAAGDSVVVHSKKGSMVFARMVGRGRRKVKFHVTNLEKAYFIRPRSFRQLLSL